jgi:hypothetical protein
MNEIPKFEAGKPLMEQLTATKLNMLSQGILTNGILPGVGYRVTQTPGGAIVSPIKRRRGVPITLLPFEVSVRNSTDILISAGVIGATAIAEVVEESPADATWYAEAKVVINNTTGAITSSAVQWVSGTASSNTTTDFYALVGSIDVADGVPDSATIVQYNYGPLFVLTYGAPTDIWKVDIL